MILKWYFYFIREEIGKNVKVAELRIPYEYALNLMDILYPNCLNTVLKRDWPIETSHVHVITLLNQLITVINVHPLEILNFERLQG